MRTSMVLEAIEQAIWVRSRENCDDMNDVIHHTDRGSQYIAIAVTERLPEAGIRPSVGAVGSSFDNALAERINGLYKTEEINPHGPWEGVDQIEFATAEWVDWFQPPPPLRVVRRHPTGRARGHPLRSSPDPATRRAQTDSSPDSLGGSHGYTLDGPTFGDLP